MMTALCPECIVREPCCRQRRACATLTEASLGTSDTDKKGANDLQMDYVSEKGAEQEEPLNVSNENALYCMVNADARLTEKENVSMTCVL